jgi:intracellular multiplication protein IcmL
MAATVAVALTHDVLVWINPPQTKYILIDGNSAPRPIAAVDSPVKSDVELLEWTTEAVIAPYNVDYFNYAKELNTASRRFTVKGWNSFAKSFVDSGNFAEIKRAMLLCHAQIQRAALIHQTSYREGALAYDIEVPVVQTCENSNQASNEALLISATVIRINADDHPDGLAIDQLVAKKLH